MYNLSAIQDYKALTKDNILTVSSEEEIMRYYLGFDFEIGRTYNSPLRKDNNPSFALYYNRYNQLKFKDFNGIQGSCFDLVMNLYNLGFVETLIRINNNMKLGLGYQDGSNQHSEKDVVRYTGFKAKIIKKSNLIQFKPQHFTPQDLEYWHQYGITKDILKKYDVYSAKYVFLNKVLVLRYFYNNPIYCYKFSNAIKVYRPEAKKGNFKWMSNITSRDIQGLNQLPKSGNTLIITKALKDVMCLHALGYNAIAPQSETTYMAEDIVKDITSRFNHIYILFDLDDAGRKGAYMLNTYLDSKIVFIPYVDYKDITDYYKVMGKTKTLKLLNKIIVW